MFKKFLKSKLGAASIEYAIIASLVGAVVVAGVTNVGEQNAQNYNEISQSVNDASN